MLLKVVEVEEPFATCRAAVAVLFETLVDLVCKVLGKRVHDDCLDLLWLR